jgi:hypothetical protein
MDHYLPIYPTKKFQKGGVQRKFWRGNNVTLSSYIRIDNVKEVPLQVLAESVRSDGLGVML